MTLKDHNKI